MWTDTEPVTFTMLPSTERGADASPQDAQVTLLPQLTFPRVARLPRETEVNSRAWGRGRSGHRRGSSPRDCEGTRLLPQRGRAGGQTESVCTLAEWSPHGTVRCYGQGQGQGEAWGGNGKDTRTEP